MVTVCFYLEQRSIHGPDLAPWLALRNEFGCELVGIRWKHVETNSDLDRIQIVPSIYAVIEEHKGEEHVFLSETENGTALAGFRKSQRDTVYFIGRNSHGFRSDLDNLSDFFVRDVKWLNLSGGDLWAHEAARAVLEV